MVARVEIYQNELNKLTRSIGRRMLKTLVRKVERQARIRALRYTGKSIPPPRGRLAASIKGRVFDEAPDRVGAEVIATAAHSLMVHNGTEPHIIRPRVVRLGQGRYAHSRGGLKFFWLAKGKYVCIKGPVRHPGYRGRKFLFIPLLQEGTAMGFKVTPLAVTSRFQR
jgi:hypothetical protein